MRNLICLLQLTFVLIFGTCVTSLPLYILVFLPLPTCLLSQEVSTFIWLVKINLNLRKKQENIILKGFFSPRFFMKPNNDFETILF